VIFVEVGRAPTAISSLTVLVAASIIDTLSALNLATNKCEPFVVKLIPEGQPGVTMVLVSARLVVSYTSTPCEQ
jgi:hypothetical protein